MGENVQQELLRLLSYLVATKIKYANRTVVAPASLKEIASSQVSFIFPVFGSKLRVPDRGIVKEGETKTS